MDHRKHTTVIETARGHVHHVRSLRTKDFRQCCWTLPDDKDTMLNSNSMLGLAWDMAERRARTWLIASSAMDSVLQHSKCEAACSAWCQQGK